MNFKKLRRRSFKELGHRARQLLRVFAERLAVRLHTPVNMHTDRHDRFPRRTSSENDLARFRARESRFFAAFSDKSVTQTCLRKHMSDEEQCALIREANQILLGKFDLLGHRNISFGDPIDWSLEPTTGKVTGLEHWSRIRFLDAEIAGDKKVTWELSRQQHLIVLGRAYWLTDDERYAGHAAKLLGEWMRSNPPQRGINWASSLEVSFRLMSWIWCLHFLKNSPALTAPTFRDCVQAMHTHAAHISRNLSTYFSPNTHLTGEALGLYMFGHTFPESKNAKRWLKLGKSILEREMGVQIRSDGVYFEQSTWYHRYTTDIYVQFCILSALSHATPVGPLCDFLMHAARPDGKISLVGDDDGGQLAPLQNSDLDDIRPTLLTASALLARPDFKYVAHKGSWEQVLWLMGPAGVRTLLALQAEPPDDLGAAFSESGFYSYRSKWDSTSDYSLISCGPHGALNCGHSHADALAIEICVSGRPALVDPGTFSYTGDPAARDWFRCEAAHNVVAIEGSSNSEPGGPFSWKRTIDAACTCWVHTSDFFFFDGRHLAPDNASAAALRRSILNFNGRWIIIDWGLADEPQRAKTFFHFPPGAHLHLESLNDQGWCVNARIAGKPLLQLLSPTQDGRWRFEEGWVSRVYGHRETALVAVRESQLAPSSPLVTLAVSLDGTHGYTRLLLKAELLGGFAYTFSDPCSKHILIIRTGSDTVEYGNLRTDCEITWLDCVDHDGVPAEIICTNGSFVAIGAIDIRNMGRNVRHLKL